MDPNKAEEGSGKHNAENPLPRGLEQVSHLFLSQAQPVRAIHQDRSGTRVYTMDSEYTADAAVVAIVDPSR